MNTITGTYYEGMSDPSYYHPTQEDWRDYMNSLKEEEESTHRDVQAAIELQEDKQYLHEDALAWCSCIRFGWNWNHAREIAELAWVELYAEKEGEDKWIR